MFILGKMESSCMKGADFFLRLNLKAAVQTVCGFRL